MVQAMLQFICGYHDVDLRDSTGLGHGRLIAAYASAPVRDRWLPACWLARCAGIAITEPHGGSQVHATSTTAVPRRDGTWRSTARKPGSAGWTRPQCSACSSKTPPGA